MCEENDYSFELHPDQPSCLIKNGERIKCNTTTFPCLSEHQTKALEEPKRTPAVGDHRNTRIASTVHGWMDEGMFNFHRRISLVDVTIHLQQFLLLRILHQNLLQRNHEESTIYSLIFRKARIARRTKVTKAPRRRNPDDRTDRVKIAEKVREMITADHKVFNED